MAAPHPALLVLGLIAGLLLEVQGVQTPGITKYEIVVPERLQVKSKRSAERHQQGAQGDWEDHLSYSIETTERTYLLMLKKNRGLLSEQFTQSKYTKDGRLETLPPVKQIHCYYHGHIDGVEESKIALSTCDGLRGLLHIGEKSYGIEPKEASSEGEHLLYLLEDVQKKPALCGVTDTDGGWPTEAGKPEHHFFRDVNDSYTLFRRRDLYRRKRDVLPVTSTVELSVTVDNNQYKNKNSNLTAVQMDVFQLVNAIARMFQPLNIQVVLIEMIVWTDLNPFDVDTGTAGDVLGRFSNWKGTTSGLKNSDASHLLIGHAPYGTVLGMAFVGTVCMAKLATSISAISNGESPASHASLVAHEIGHNLGMNHDDIRCGSTFIMSSADKGALNFSTCSSDDFENLILNNKGICLKNAPNPQDVLTEPECGNYIVDKGEQCDCGPPQNCTNPCCNAATCTLTSGSQCAYGLCCANCKFQGASTACRPQSDPCDLPEYCSGSDPLCPADFYIADGYPCNGSQAYCYTGRCQTLDAQCLAVFGGASQKAIDGCFQVANLRGDPYGNCGMSGGNYIKCSLADSLCGKLQCSGDHPTILNAAVFNFVYQGVTCKSIDFNLGNDVPDPGMARQGTGCGGGKACVNNHCVNSSKLGYSYDVKTQCNNNGVVDNNGSCFCNYGWAPPSCSSSGCGGSIHSGPAPCDNRLRDALLVIFLLVIPILIMVALFFKRNAIKSWWRRRNDPDRTKQPKPAGQPKPTQRQQNRYQPEDPNINATGAFTISKFPSHRPPASAPAPGRPPPPPSRAGNVTRPPIPTKPLGFQNV